MAPSISFWAQDLPSYEEPGWEIDPDSNDETQRWEQDPDFLAKNPRWETNSGPLDEPRDIAQSLSPNADRNENTTSSSPFLVTGPLGKNETGGSSSAWHTFANKGEVDPIRFMKALQGGHIQRFMGNRFRFPPKASKTDRLPIGQPPNGQPHDAVGSNIFSLTGTLPWTERMLITGLHYNLGTGNFKLYRKPFNGYTREYFLTIDKIPFDLDSELCIVGPQYRAGHNEWGFYADIEPIRPGICSLCQMIHENQVCQQTWKIDIDSVLSSGEGADLVRHSGQSPSKKRHIMDEDMDLR